MNRRAFIKGLAIAPIAAAAAVIPASSAPAAAELGIAEAYLLRCVEKGLLTAYEADALAKNRVHPGWRTLPASVELARSHTAPALIRFNGERFVAAVSPIRL